MSDEEGQIRVVDEVGAAERAVAEAAVMLMSDQERHAARLKDVPIGVYIQFPSLDTPVRQKVHVGVYMQFSISNVLIE